MLFKPGCEIASAGAVLAQADRCYGYFNDFAQSPRFQKFCNDYKAKTGRAFIIKSIQSYTEFDNGSKMEILTATDKGLRSPHPHKARIDEIDLIEWGILQTGLSMAKSKSDEDGKVLIRGQNVFTSTRQKERGPMQRLLDEAEAKGIAVYEWNIWEAVQRCPRRCEEDPVHGSCPIYVLCKGKAHHCDGFYPIDDFIDKVRLIDRDSFETEWLNTKPSKHKLVYNMIDNKTHIMTPRRLHEMVGVHHPVQMHWPRFSGLDFGASPGHPFVYAKITEMPNGAFLLMYEYVAEQRLLRDHAQRIKASPLYFPGELIYGDHDLQDRTELAALGIRIKPAKKDVLMGIDYVKSLFQGFALGDRFVPMLYIWHECKFSIDQFNAYSWPTLPDGKIDKTGNPLKRDDDCPDAVRYAVYSHRGGTVPKYSSRRIVGI